MTEPKPTYRITKPTDYRPDPHNANLGTERGTWMLEQSIREDGAARSIVVDADGMVVAGNKTLQAAIDAGLVETVEVEVEGDRLVVVRRKDWHLGGGNGAAAARRYAYRDNRSSEIGLDWNIEQILADVNEGFDLSGMWREDELEGLLKTPSPFEPNTMPSFSTARVMDEDMVKEKARLDSRFKENQEYLEVICPHCAQEFFINRKDVK